MKLSNHYYNRILFICLALPLLLSLAGCRKVKTPITKNGLYFDTVISITLYEDNSSELIDECFALATEYEDLLSKTIEGSDVTNINASAPSDTNSESDFVKINPETLYMIEKAIEYEDLSNGKFSVMCGALTDLWDISSKVGYDDKNIPDDMVLVPDATAIEEAKSKCGKDTLEIDHENCAVRINTPGASLDLGAVAKGYIADRMKEYLLSKGITEGIIQLGGNVLLIGNNPTKDSGLYSIGITKPFTANDVITVVNEADKTIVTSGNYQRYFKLDDKVYHHIIDLTTGYPADTGLNSTTIVCSSSTEADILSTVTFLLGCEEGIKLIDKLNSANDDYKIIIIDNKNDIIYNTVN